MPHHFYYARGVKGDEQLVQEHQEAIDRILVGDYTNKNIEKLQGHDVFSMRLGHAERLLFTTVTLDDGEYILVLDYLPTHDYEKSRFLKSGVLEHYREKEANKSGAAQSSSHQEPLDFAACDEHKIAQRFNKVTRTNKRQTNELDYYQNNWILLNTTQHQALSVQLPAVISGVAGSGKSCVALSLLSSFANEEIMRSEKPILYLTRSEELVNRMIQEWNRLPIAKHLGDRVHFKTYERLVHEALGNEALHLVDEKTFKQWYISYLTRQKQIQKAKQHDAINLIDAETLYREFRICTGYENDAYLALGQHGSLVSQEQRHNVLNTLQAYKEFLQANHQIDPALYLFEPDFHNQYALVVVDEAQDFSHAQAKNAAHLAVHQRIVYCVDNHQRLYDSRSVRPYLLQSLQINEPSHVILERSYRCAPAIVEAANIVLNLKLTLTQGISDKQEKTSIEAQVDHMDSLGSVHLIDENTLVSSPFLKKYSQSTSFAVVTTEENREKATAILNTNLVFTPEQIKGLEYACVLVWGICDKNLFKQAYARYQEIKDKKLPTGRAKSGLGDDRFNQDMNRIYTSYTRAHRQLIICEENNHHNALLLTPLQSLNKPLPNEAELMEPSSREQWLSEVEKLVRSGHQQQAQQIFLAKIGSFNEFEALIKTHQNRQAPSSPSRKTEVEQPKPERYSIIREESKKPRQPKNNPTPAPNEKKQQSISKQSITAKVQPQPQNHEQHFASMLQKKFNEAILSQCIANPDLDLNKLFTKPYVNRESLLDYIAKDKARCDSFLRCIINNPRVYFTSKNLKEVMILSAGRVKYSKQFRTKMILLNQMPGEYSEEIINDFLKLNYYPQHIAACNVNFIQLLHLFRELKIDFNIQTEVGYTPLSIATINGNIDAIDGLRAGGAQLDKQSASGDTAAYLAAYNNRLEILKKLDLSGADLNRANNDGYSPLTIAAKRGYSAIVQFLIDKKVDINTLDNRDFTPIQWAVEKGHLEAFEILLDNGAELKIRQDGFSPLLHHAVTKKQTDIVKSILNKNPQINLDIPDERGETLVQITILEDSKEILEILICAGADIHNTGSSGETPLGLAAISGSLGLIELLYQNGADLNATNSQNKTPIQLAAQYGQMKVVVYLTNLGANLEQPDLTGVTPISEATRSLYSNIVEYLFKQNVDVNKPDQFGLTPIFHAVIQSDSSLVALLLPKSNQGHVINVTKEELLDIFKEKLNPDKYEAIHDILSPKSVEKKRRYSLIDIAKLVGNQEIIDMLLKGQQEQIPVYSPFSLFSPQENKEGHPSLQLKTTKTENNYI